MQHYSSARNRIYKLYKSKRIRHAFTLAFLLGPFGLFYTDSFGGLVMFSLSLIILLLLPASGLILIWIGCAVWAVIAALKARKVARKYDAYFRGRY